MTRKVKKLVRFVVKQAVSFALVDTFFFDATSVMVNSGGLDINLYLVTSRVIL